MPELETYDADGNQYIILDATGLQTSSHYGESGGGFGYLKFRLRRPASHENKDIGYGYRVIWRKYKNTYKFDGLIRKIEDISAESTEEVSISAFGMLSIASDDEFLRAYCDKRLSLWKPPSELPKGNFKPNFYSTGSNEVGLYLHPNNGTIIQSNQRTELGYNFYQQETAQRLKVDLSMVLGNGIVFHAQVNPAFSAQIDTPTPPSAITYTADSGEDNIDIGDTLKNTTRNQTAVVATITTGTNTMTFSSGDITTWESGDNIQILFSGDEMFYDGDSGEDDIYAGMVLWNLTKDREAEITQVYRPDNRITVESAGLLVGWEEDDDVYVAGPLFWAQIEDIVGPVITYTEEIAEGNLSGTPTLINLSKKAIATVASSDTGANTITVSDEDHIDGWDITDVIIIVTSMFYATIASVADDLDGSGTVTWTLNSDIGTPVVSSDVGWVLYNEDLDEFATVDGWTVGSREIGVDTWSEISGWSATEVIRIYTPYRVALHQTDGTRLWPVSDVREGAIPRNRYAINVEPDNETSTSFHILFRVFISGVGGESSFAQLSNVRAYSTDQPVTASMLASEAVTMLSQSGHGLSSSEDDVETSIYEIEPMVFEYMSPAEAMAWACKFGDKLGSKFAWGIRMDDRQRLYLETQDLDRVDYIVRRTGPMRAAVVGDIGDSLQIVRASYTDKLGISRATYWISDVSAYWQEYFRRGTIPAEGVDTHDEAMVIAQLYLNENAAQRKSGKFTVEEGSIFNTQGVPVAIDELRAKGGLVMIEEWRSVDAAGGSADLRSWTVEQIVAVEIDHGSKTANLTPASPKSDLETYLANLARMASR
jgi:hypothetical protein